MCAQRMSASASAQRVPVIAYTHICTYCTTHMPVRNTHIITYVHTHIRTYIHSLFHKHILTYIHTCVTYMAVHLCVSHTYMYVRNIHTPVAVLAQISPDMLGIAQSLRRPSKRHKPCGSSFIWVASPDRENVDECSEWVLRGFIEIRDSRFCELQPNTPGNLRAASHQQAEGG